MDRRAATILRRFEATADRVAEEIAAASMAEIPAFAAMDDPRLRAEIRELAHRHVTAFVAAARTGSPPDGRVLAAARERAVARARQMVPLAALLHSHLLAQRIISAGLTRAADPDAASRGVALDLVGRTFDYNITVTSAVVEAYLDVVQGDLLDLNAARWAVVDAVVVGGSIALPELTRRAAGLGFAADRRHVLALIRSAGDRQRIGDVARAVARATGRPERTAFVAVHDDEIVALLEADGGRRAEAVLADAVRALTSTTGGGALAGVGRPFVGLVDMAVSYRDARRALRHANSARPVVTAPGDLRLFDELTLSRDDATELIPDAVRTALADEALLDTVDRYVEADMSTAEAAARLNLHPNSLRYRLRRIADLTGLDPTRLSDLLELLAAARLLREEQRRRPRALPRPRQSEKPAPDPSGRSQGNASR